jgi:hypothetical protein
VSCLPLLTATAVHVIVGIRRSTRNTRRCCSTCTRSGAASRRRQPSISGDDHEWRVIARIQNCQFSATTVALCMSTLALFPMYSLKSCAYVGVAVVAFAAVAAIVVTPVAIALLGQRLTRRLHGRAKSVQRPVQQTFWRAG